MCRKLQDDWEFLLRPKVLGFVCTFVNTRTRLSITVCGCVIFMSCLPVLAFASRWVLRGLVGRTASLAAPTTNHLLFIHQEKDTSGTVLPSKPRHTSPWEQYFVSLQSTHTVFTFVSSWNGHLGTLLHRGPKPEWFISLKRGRIFFKSVSIGPTRGQPVNKGSAVDLVRPIDQDTAVLVCSSEPVFEFVLGGDPDRLVRVTGKPDGQQAWSRCCCSFL